MSFAVKLKYDAVPYEEILTLSSKSPGDFYDTTDIDDLKCIGISDVFVARTEEEAQNVIDIVCGYMSATFEIIPATTRHEELAHFVANLTAL